MTDGTALPEWLHFGHRKLPAGNADELRTEKTESSGNDLSGCWSACNFFQHQTETLLKFNYESLLSSVNKSSVNNKREHFSFRVQHAHCVLLKLRTLHFVWAQGRLYHRATRAAARGPRLKGPQRRTNDEGKICFFLEFFFEKKI